MKANGNKKVKNRCLKILADSKEQRTNNKGCKVEAQKVATIILQVLKKQE